MIAIVVTLTAGLSVLAVRLRIGIPPNNSTQIAQVARAAVGAGRCSLPSRQRRRSFSWPRPAPRSRPGQGSSRRFHRPGAGSVSCPRRSGVRTKHHTPYWGVAAFLAISALILTAAGAREQRLVLFYAVAVFAAFLCGLLAMSKFFHAERRRLLLVASLTGACAVGLTLAINVARVTRSSRSPPH
jgi:hypothetical protein